MNPTDLFTNEAISNYITFAAGILVAVIGFVLQRKITQKQPKMLKLVKIGQSSILEVNPKIKDDLAIKFKEIPVQSLYLTNCTLSNTSDDILENILVKVQVTDINHLLHVGTEDSLNREIKIESVDYHNGIVQIDIPYMNSKSLYKDIIRLNFFSREKIVFKKVSGGGREWAVKYLDVEEETSAIFDRFTDNPATNLAILIVNLSKMIRVLMALR